MPITTAPQSAKFSDIANTIITQLVAVTGIDPTYIRTVASDDYELELLDDHILYFRYYGLEPWTDYGAGRRVRRCKRLFRIYIYSRNSSDSVGDDTIALLDPLAHSDLEESVMNALDEFTPAAAGAALVVEPLHPLADSDGPPLRRAEDDIGVIRSSQLYEIQYVLPNTTTTS